MAGYLAAADRLRETFHCLVLIIHHCGLEQGRPRGHTSLTGAADVQISIKLFGDTSALTVEFLKDGEEGVRYVRYVQAKNVRTRTGFFRTRTPYMAQTLGQGRWHD